MNNSRLIGIILGVLGFGIAVLAGLWIAVQVGGGMSMGAALLGALLAFIPVALLIGGGLFLFIQGGREVERESEVRQQRQLLDIVRSRGQISVHELALELNINVDKVKSMIHELVGLQVFSGYINWKDGMLFSSDAAQLRDLKQCKNCGGQIELVGRGVVACPFCGMEYFLT